MGLSLAALMNDIIQVEETDLKELMLDEMICLVVNTETGRYWFDDVIQYHQNKWEYERKNIRGFYVSMWKRDLYSKLMSGEYRTQELKKMMILELKSKDKSLATFARFIIGNFDTIFKS